MIVAGFLVMYLFLGCILDTMGMMVVTLPVVFPIIEGMGFSGIWFGVLLVVMVEIAMVTPPVGLVVYIVKASAGDQVELQDILRGSCPSS